MHFNTVYVKYYVLWNIFKKYFRIVVKFDITENDNVLTCVKNRKDRPLKFLKYLEIDIDHVYFLRLHQHVYIFELKSTKKIKLTIVRTIIFIFQKVFLELV